MPPTRSVAKADVAELSAALDSAVDAEKAHHLVIVSTNKVLSTTQFKQMFYSRGDDFFQIANVYECPDSCNSVHSSVWGIDCMDPHDPSEDPPTTQGLHTMGHDRLAGSGGVGGANNYKCFNFNKLGGRENDPKGCAWAYSYVHDQSRNFYAQHEVMGYLEKDTCVKRDFWTACSRMSIEDQLYGLAFASETDQDLCMAVTCARRWSEVEDALAESCTAADREIACPVEWTVATKTKLNVWGETWAALAPPIAMWGEPPNPPANGPDTYTILVGGVTIFKFTTGPATLPITSLGPPGLITTPDFVNAVNATANTTPVITAAGAIYTGPDGHTIYLAPGFSFQTTSPASASYWTVSSGSYNQVWTDQPTAAALTVLFVIDGCNEAAADMGPLISSSTTSNSSLSALELEDDEWQWAKRIAHPTRAEEDQYPTTNQYALRQVIKPQYIDLYINVRVSNGHPKSLDTILRVRFTVAYVLHVPSALNTWNIRASTAAAGVIQSGVVGDAPEGGKEQHEDTTVVVA